MRSAEPAGTTWPRCSRPVTSNLTRPARSPRRALASSAMSGDTSIQIPSARGKRSSASARNSPGPLPTSTTRPTPPRSASATARASRRGRSRRPLIWSALAQVRAVELVVQSLPEPSVPAPGAVEEIDAVTVPLQLQKPFLYPARGETGMSSARGAATGPRRCRDRAATVPRPGRDGARALRESVGDRPGRSPHGLGEFLPALRGHPGQRDGRADPRDRFAVPVADRAAHRPHADLALALVVRVADPPDLRELRHKQGTGGDRVRRERGQ